MERCLTEIAIYGKVNKLQIDLNSERGILKISLIVKNFIKKCPLDELLK